ncbi:MAG TPA: sigma-70 family RNA polymerase sigma factor [Planctomycetota bacterium]
MLYRNLRPATLAMHALVGIGPASGTGMTGAADHDEDRELVRRALAGQADAVDGMVVRLKCVPRVLRVLNQRVGNPLAPEDLSDLGQDVVMAFWKRLADYTGRASLETWAYGFCLNTFMSALRRRRWRALDRLETETLEEARPLPALGEHEVLQRALQDLAEREERVIRLKYYEDLTFEEIGRRLGISPNTAKTCFYRGMQRLERRMRAGEQAQDGSH